MSNIPKTLNEDRRDRASTKRKITNLLKEGDSILTAYSGLPNTEFRKLAERIREELDILHVNNEHYIHLKCSVLVLGEDATEEKRGLEEETIADTETNYLDEVRDRVIPMIHELIKIAERVLRRDLPPIPISPFPAAHMQKLTFPTFSEDIRDDKQFKELFIHFTKHLDQTECLYQLVDSMQRPAERKKIKPCTSIYRARQILDESYGDDDRLVDILLCDIENLNSYTIKGRVNFAEMDKFTESIQNFITQVEGINMTQYLNGRLLVTQIRRKLPEEHCLLLCHRCGHNNCVAGKHPFNYEDCQFIENCQIPTCGMNTLLLSICPRVYGLDGYDHFDRKYTRVDVLNADAENFLPSKSQPIYKNSNPMSESSSSGKDRVTCALPTVMGYIRHGAKKTKMRILLDTGSQISLIRERIIPQSDNNYCYMQYFNLTTVGGATVNSQFRVVECALESLDGTFNREVRLTEMKRPCGDAHIVTNSQLRHYPHLEDIAIVESHDERIDVLLGVENGDILTSEERVLGTDHHDSVAVRCPLGGYIQWGRCAEDNRANAAVNFTQVSAIGDVNIS